MVARSTLCFAATCPTTDLAMQNTDVGMALPVRHFSFGWCCAAAASVATSSATERRSAPASRMRRRLSLSASARRHRRGAEVGRTLPPVGVCGTRGPQPLLDALPPAARRRRVCAASRSPSKGTVTLQFSERTLARRSRRSALV